MKSNLIINIISAHIQKKEQAFHAAVKALIDDEERKGNVSLALQVREILASGSHHAHSAAIGTSASPDVFLASALPKDKDSALSLVDIITPEEKLSEVLLPSEISENIYQIIHEQKRVDELSALGMAPTHKLLFFGPPGCGKTLTAHAIAHELGLPLVEVKLDGLVSSFLGQTGANIRKVFDFVKNQKVVLFLDEFDAIAKKRDDAQELGELKRVVTTLLQNIDALSPEVFLIAATNHEQLLDPAIWRRFQMTIRIDLPTSTQRQELIEETYNKYLKNITHSIDKKLLCSLSEGMSCAELVSFLQYTGKYLFLNNSKNVDLDQETISRLWIKCFLLTSGNSDDAKAQVCVKLKDIGLPMRTIERITGIPKSTISYRLKAMR